MIPSMDWSHTSSFVLPLLVFVIILRRSLRERKVKTNRMWIYPAILGGAALYTMAHEPMPGLAAIAGFIGAAIAGAGLGYLRARHQQFTLDPATGEISSKATPIGMILIGGFFVLRFALEFTTHARDVPHALGLQRATDIGLIFSFALMAAQRWEIWKRAQAMRAGKGAIEIAPPQNSPPPQ
jgi:hypothetical protein